MVVEAASLDEDGRGVCRLDDGTEARIEDFLPGERAEVAIDHRSRQRPVSWGHIVARVSPLAAERAAPACPAFGRCGGCRWQHWDYPAQLRGKRERIVAALAAAGIDAPVAETVPSPRKLGYRNAGKYVVAGHRGDVVLGAYLPRSHQVISTLGCRVVEPVIDRAAGATKAALDQTGLLPYRESARAGHLRYVLIRAGDDGAAAITLVTTPDTPPAPLADAAAVLANTPGVAGVAWMKNAARSGRITSPDITPLAGRIDTRETIAGATLAIAPDAFFQVNRDQARALYDRAASLAGARAGMRAIDAFCGAGGIALTFARAGAQVAGIETNQAAIDAATRAAQAAGLKARFSQGDAAALAELARGFRPQVIIVNPPRKGLAENTRGALLCAGAARIVYVSCHPGSFARDARQLVSSGYRLVSVTPYDLMPGTAQVESLAIFETAAEMST